MIAQGNALGSESPTKDRSPERAKQRLLHHGNREKFHVAILGEQPDPSLVKRYIENQAEHHRTRTFQDELRELFHRNQIKFDERYVWD